jgi:hypothetical protein
MPNRPKQLPCHVLDRPGAHLYLCQVTLYRSDCPTWRPRPPPAWPAAATGDNSGHPCSRGHWVAIMAASTRITGKLFVPLYLRPTGSSSVASLSPIKLTGFSRRLVENGLLSEEVAVEALSKSRQENVSLVSHLVKRKLASSLDIAMAAAEEFGTPLLDLDAFDAIVRFVNKVLLDAIRSGASDIHFEPYEKSYRIRVRTDGILQRSCQTATQSGHPHSVAPEDHVADGHLRTPPAAGRPHQDEAVAHPRHRLPREYLADAVGREGGAANPRSGQRADGHRRAGLRGGAERPVHACTRPASRA